MLLCCCWKALTIVQESASLCADGCCLCVQTLRTSGGSTSSGYSCAGAAGTLYVLNGTASSLTFDNGGGSSASSTCTPFPTDLNGVQLSSLNVSGRTCLDLRQAGSYNDVRAYELDLDVNSKITGDSVVIDTSNASLRGSITASSALWLHNAQSGAGTVTAFSGSTITCSSCTMRMTLAGSNVRMHGAITATVAEVRGLQSISHTGSLRVMGSQLMVEAGTASMGGTVTCSGAACSSLVSVNGTLEVGGAVSCTNGKCRLSMRCGGSLRSTGTISCSGNSQCLIDLAIGGSAQLGGSTRGSDIRIVAADGLEVLGRVATDEQGYIEYLGDGKGARSSWSTSYTYSSFRVSGSGGGHGGDGASSCYRYSSSYGSIPSGISCA
jgi:hypothetical protein